MSQRGTDTQSRLLLGAEHILPHDDRVNERVVWVRPTIYEQQAAHRHVKVLGVMVGNPRCPIERSLTYFLCKVNFIPVTI